MSELYNKIKSYCFLNRAMTVSAMCEAIGISKSTMSNLKNGKTVTLSPLILQKIADFLDVPLSKLTEDEQLNKPIVEQKFIGEEFDTARINRLLHYAKLINDNPKLETIIINASECTGERLDLLVGISKEMRHLGDNDTKGN